MQEIRLSTESSDNTLITFDGRVVEFFSIISPQSCRIHVFEISNIEIVTDKRGRHTFNINSRYLNDLILSGLTVREEALVEMQTLVASVRAAMALYP
jgi:hypothetical protein